MLFRSSWMCWFMFLYCLDFVLLDFCGFFCLRFCLIYFMFCLLLCFRFCFVICCVFLFFGCCFSLCYLAFSLLLMERECFDLFGLFFLGNDCLYRFICDWFFVGFFLLKCYPVYGFFCLLFCGMMMDFLLVCNFVGLYMNLQSFQLKN